LVEPKWRPLNLDTGRRPENREELTDSAFAFPKQRREPLTDATHVWNALARFDQVEDVSDEDRGLALANIERAPEHFGVEVQEESWKGPGEEPRTPNPSQ